MRLLTTSVLAVEEVGLKKLCNICRMLMDAQAFLLLRFCPSNHILHF